MISVANAIDDRIAHHNIRMRHINLQAQNMFTIFKFAIAHFTEEGKIFCRAAVTERAIFSSLAKVTAIGMNVFSTLTVNIRLPILNQNFCKLVQAIKVITGVIQMITPAKAQPFHRIQNTVGILNIFLNRIGVIQTHIAASAARQCVVVSRQAKVQANTFGMTDMQVAIWLWWKAGNDRWDGLIG